MGYRKETIAKLNQDIREFFPYLTEIQPEDHTIHSGVSRLVMLDRYAQKDRELRTLGIGDIVLTVIKEDPKYPARGVGVVKAIDWENESVTIEIEEEFRGTLEDEQESITGMIRRPFAEIDKPMEIYYEQIARRVGTALAEPETDEEQRKKYAGLFTEQLKKLNVIPVYRVFQPPGGGQHR